nr:polysaccharide pyruvyl transferase family protein [Auraticoccus cholistanensis]
MTGHEAVFAEPDEPHYVTIGSVLRRVTSTSVVWGTGSFGTEPGSQVNKEATYTAVRGPLTRARMKHYGMTPPQVYGDPALLVPLYHRPTVPITHEIGVIVRWSEREWASAEVGPGVRLIDYASDDVEGIIEQMLSCRRLISSSLHGLIVADAYGIPNAWLASDSPKGGEFKFHDYFASVRKHRYPHDYDLAAQPLTVAELRRRFTFSPEPIDFNYRLLLDACPFLTRDRGRPRR